MSGFGHGPFGHFSFGHTAYDRDAFEDRLPRSFLASDADGYLRGYLRAIGGAIQQEKRVVEAMPRLRDVWAATTSLTDPVHLLLGGPVRGTGAQTQHGADGAVLSLGEFSAPSARFTEADRGRALLIEGRESARVAVVVNATTVLPDVPLQAGTGLSWEVREGEVREEGVLALEVVGDVSRLRPGWVLTDGDASFEVLGADLFLARDGRHLTLAEGSDAELVGGSLVGARVGLSPLFAPLFVQSADRTVSGVYLVGEVLSNTEVVLWDRATFSPVSVSATGVFWAQRPTARLRLRALAPPRGALLAGGSGADAAGGASGTVSLPGARLTAADVGRLVTLYPAAAAGPPITAELASVAGVTEGTLTPLSGNPAVPVLTGAAWELRVAPSLARSDALVRVTAPSELALFAGDFGLTLDPSEPEARQRGWVDGQRLWRDRKGSVEAHRTVGALTGVPVDLVRLYRLSAALATRVPSDHQFPMPESVAGRRGFDGAVSFEAGELRLTSPTAAFRGSDRSRLIRLWGASVTPDPGGYYEIRRVVSPTVVILGRASLPVVLPFATAWEITTVYTDLPPRRPRMRDVAPDVAAAEGVLPPDGFTWDAGYAHTVAAEVLNGAVLSGTLCSVSLQGSTVGIVGAVGSWRLIDVYGVSYWFETAPVLTAAGPPPQWSATVLGMTSPSPGACELRYEAPLLPTADYAPAAAVLATVTASGSGAAALLQRWLRRVRDVLPLHERLIARRADAPDVLYDDGIGLV